MSGNSTNIIYAASGIIIVLIVVLIAQSVIQSRNKYKADAVIAVKTSKGIIKMNAKHAAHELSKISADLNRHQGYKRTSKFDIEITDAIEQIKHFIASNPHSNDMCKGETKASILDNAMADRLTPHHYDQHLAHAALLSHDDLEYGPDSIRFDYLLKHIDVMIHMLQRDVCDDGIINVKALEDLLHALDADLSAGASFDKSTGVWGDSRFETEFGKDIAHRYDPYAIPKLALFSSKQSQMEGFSIETQLRGLPDSTEKRFTLGPQNARNAQQRSQMFRENRIRLGVEHYNDEDMLGLPTPEQYAL